MNKRERVELRCHSFIGYDDGTIAPERILQFAENEKMPAVAITDRGGVFSFAELEDIWKNKKFATRPIYGMEAYILDDRPSVMAEKDIEKERALFRISILVMNRIGKESLFSMVTEMETKYKKGDIPYIPLSLLIQNRDGLLIGSGGCDGKLYRCVHENLDDDTLASVAGFYDYIEVEPVRRMYEKYVPPEEEEKYRGHINRITVIGKRLNIPVVAVSNAYYLRPEEQFFRNVMRYAKDIHGDNYSEAHFRTTEEMLRELDFLGTEKAYEIVVENSNKLAERCETVTIAPTEKTYPWIEKAVERLRDTCEAAIPKHYPEGRLEEASKRLDWELASAEKTKTAFVFLQIRELLDKLELRSCDISLRGCLGNSIIAYLMGISEADPLMYHLSPELVFGYEGEREIDICVNVPKSLHKKAFEVCGSLEGLGAAVRIGSNTTFSHDDPHNEVYWYEKAKGTKYPGFLKMKAEEAIKGGFRWRGVHPGGVMFIPKDRRLSEFTPVCTYDSENKSSSKVMCFDYKYYRNCLFKLDVSDHGVLDRLRDLAEMTGVNIETIPLEDEAVISLLDIDEENQHVPGFDDIPDFRVRTLQEALCGLRPKNFDGLVRAFSVIHGSSWFTGGKDLIESGRAEPNEIITCLDDVFDRCISLGIDRWTAYGITEDVRRGRVHDNKSKLWPEWKEMLTMAGAPEWFIESCEKTEYLFPRAAAVSYVLMLWRLAWFKVHYPETYAKENRKYWQHRPVGFEEDACQKLVLDACIRNKEVREQFRDIYFDAVELLSFIHHAYMDIREKYELVQELNTQFDLLLKLHGVESSWQRKPLDVGIYLTTMKKIYEKVIECIFSPDERCIYFVEYIYPQEPRPEESWDDVIGPPSGNYDIYDSMEEVVKSIEEYYPAEDGKVEFNVTLIMIPEEGPHHEPISFKIHWIDRKLSIFNFCLDQAEEILGLSPEETQLFDNVDDFYSISHEELPYKYGEYLKLKTPMMEEAYIGKYMPAIDSGNCWYNFLYGVDETDIMGDVLDLSYHELNVASPYTSWDWISKAKPEEVKEFREKYRGSNNNRQEDGIKNARS